MNKFRIIAELGRGGMAKVYAAVAQGPQGFSKLVVVKQLLPDLSRDAGFVAMFLDEARLAARLSHPNVVQTYEVHAEAGEYFLVMEYLEGQALSRLFSVLAESTGVPVDVALRIVHEVLSGLHYAHELASYDGQPLGVVHRDVTPQNVFLTYDGQVKLVDFGIAKALDSTTATRLGALKGKVAYMAPEQARGEAVDRRADVFGAGVVLWELLAGRRLWQHHPEPVILNRLAHGDVPSLSSAVSHAPPELVELTARALHPRPAERFATALAFQRAIRAYLTQLGRTPDAAQLANLMDSTFADERARAKLVISRQLALEGTPVTRPELMGPVPSVGEPVSLTLPSSAQTLQPPPGSTPILGPGREVHDAPTRVQFVARRGGGARWLAAGLLIALGGAGAYIALNNAARAREDGSVERSGSPRPATPAAAVRAVVAPCGGSNKPLVELSGDITEDATLECDKDYLLKFTTFVRPGATLTIRPGTVIRGDKATKGTLVVQPGARIEAEGRRDLPIVFTSAQPAGQRRAGDWGGVIVLGDAPINLVDASGTAARGRIEGIPNGGEYGGDDPDDYSGTLRYVRIEYSGVSLGPNNEINGLSLGGVGRRTTLDHIQVRYTLDDCFEFFGGNVDGKHLICYRGGDDAFDWDFGYRGRLQFIVHVDDPAARGESNGIEGDNDPNASNNRPVSHPTLYNATLCGKQRKYEREQYGLLLRRGTRAVIANALVTGYSAALDLRDANTRVEIRSSLFFRNLEHNLAFPELGSRRRGAYHDDDSGFDEAAWLLLARHQNSDVDPGGITCAPEAHGPPRYRLETALTANAEQPPSDGFFTTDARFVGAFRDRDDRWDEGAWTAWEDGGAVTSE